MVSTSMMASLVDAVAGDARLILVGDPDQLASVEAGAVLGDIVGPALVADAAAPATPIAAGIVVLRHVHRYGGAIAELAAAVQRGDVDAVGRRAAATAAGNVEWIVDDAPPTATVRVARRPVRDRVVGAGRRITTAAAAGDARAALDALREVPRPVRPSPRAVRRHRVDEPGRAMARRRRSTGYGADGPWYVGRPLLVTTNEHTLRLYNGDTGVIVRGPTGAPVAAFERGGADRRAQPPPPGRRRHRARDDGAQEPGLAVPQRGRRAARADVADPHPRAALHRRRRGPRSTSS